MAAALTGRWRSGLVLAGLAVVAALVVVMVVATLSDDDEGASAPAPTTVPVGGTLRVGIVGAALPTDPAAVEPTDAGAAVLAELLWARLTTTDPDTGEVRPALAESWEADADQRRVTFHLRPDVVFSDGRPVTADDVVASLDRVAAQGAGSLAGARLQVVEGWADAPAGVPSGLAAPDPGTVVVALAEPVADLPALLSGPAFAVVPAEVARGERPAVPGPTSGPYAWEAGTGEAATLRRAPATPPEAARPEVVEVVRFATPDAAADAYDSGALDLLPLPGGVPDLVGPGIGVVRVSPAASMWWVAADTTDPVLGAVEVRRALGHVADRAALVEEALPGRRPAEGVVPTQVPGGAGGTCGDGCAHDPDAARAGLATAFPQGAPTMRLDGPDQAGPAAAVAAYAGALDGVGVPTEVRTRSASEYRTTVLTPDRQLFWFGWVGVAPTPEAYLPALFLSGSPDNVTGLADAEVDAAIRAARSTADPAERAERWSEAERLVLDRMPVVPLAQGEHATALSARVQGFAQRLDGTVALDRLWLAP